MPTTTKYIWDDDNLLAEADATDTISTVYTNEPEQYGNLVSTRTSGTTSYHHFDAIGSTRQLTNSTGGVTDRATYDAWGSTVVRSGATNTTFLWTAETGYCSDASTGAVYVRRRTVIHLIARWVLLDTAGFVDGPNRYLYVLNRPVNLQDPSGRIVACSASCVRSPGDDLNRVNDVGPRGGRLTAKLTAKRNSALVLASEMRADFGFPKAVDARPQWFEPKVPKPMSYALDCCCCCDRAGWAQVFVETWKGTPRSVAMLPFHESGVGYIDHALPYPDATQTVPCSSGTRSAILIDGPNWTEMVKFLDAGGTELSQEFTSCRLLHRGP